MDIWPTLTYGTDPQADAHQPGDQVADTDGLALHRTATFTIPAASFDSVLVAVAEGKLTVNQARVALGFVPLVEVAATAKPLPARAISRPRLQVGLFCPF